MSLSFEIADWKFELTWDGIACLPVQRDSWGTTAGLAAAERADSRSHHEETAESEPNKYIQEGRAIHYELN